MAIIRIIAWVLVGLGLALLGADGISTMEQGVPVIRTTAEIISLFGPEVGLIEAGGAGKVANFFLSAPLWAVIGGIGVILTLIFRPIE